MKAPKCYRCEGRHWSTQPCPASNTASNKRLTASNSGARGSVEAGNQRGSGSAGQEPSIGVEATDKRLAPTRAPGDDERPRGNNAGSPSREVLAVIGDSSAEPRTPHQRWSREAYNAYMRDYMVGHREKRRKKTRA